MDRNGNDVPERVVPYIIQRRLNEPVLVAKGPFMLVGPKEGALDANLMFRWLPSIAVEFEGAFPQGYLEPQAQWSLAAEGDGAFRTPVYITRSSTVSGSTSSRVNGILLEPLSIGDSRFEELRFSLANFPNYLGAPVRYEREGTHGIVAGRLYFTAAQGVCHLDVVLETEELRKRASQDAGFVISHVGQWLPSNGAVSVQDAGEVLELLRVWLGFLRGAWTGPLFPQGLSAGKVVWKQFAAWPLRDSQQVTTWLPERRRLDLASAFSRFAELWDDPAWRGPLKLAVSWLVQANGSGVTLESKIVLAQVALELLAWVHLVETQELHSRRAFKVLSASDRIRALLDHIGVPPAIPDHLANLPTICRGNAFDGPGVIASVRNDLVHATDSSRAAVEALSAEQLFECSQLALQYIELALLSICGYSGHYARRGWQGWKGDDEVLVPWSMAG